MKPTLPLIALLLLSPYAAATPAHAAKARHQTTADPGVDVGTVNASTTLFAAPDPDSEKICSLKRGEATVLVSRTPQDGWLNVIQYSSGRQGWVKASRLQVKYTHHPKPRVDLPTESTGSDDPPVISIQNKSDRTMYLHVGTQPEIAIPSHSQQDVTVDPGVNSFNASAANATPLFGTKAFLTGDKYTWLFWVERSGESSRKHIDPSLKAEAQRLQAEVATESGDLNSVKQQLDDEQNALKAQESKIKQDRADVDAKRQSLDQTSQAAIDSFNAEVDSTNAESQAYRDALKKYNTDADDYNRRLNALTAKQDRLEKIANTINSQ